MAALNASQNEHQEFKLDEFKIKLTFAQERLVRQCGGGSLAALLCEMSPASISIYCNIHKPQTMPALVVARLENYVGRPIVSRVLASVTGFDLEAVAGDGATAIELSGQTHVIMQELGEYAGALNAALENDMKVDNHELDELILEIGDVLEPVRLARDALVAERARRNRMARKGDNIKALNA